MKASAPKHIKFAVLAADTALFTVQEGRVLVRIIKVTRPPHFPDNPGLPGGLLDPQETAEEAALRHVAEKTGIDTHKVYIEQLATFSRTDRDPRGRVVAVAYLALVPWEKLSENEKTQKPETSWQPVSGAQRLAYDHDEILSVALKRLRSRITYTTLLQKLMPKEFTLTELEETYEGILGTQLDKRNFRKKILSLHILKTSPHKRTGGRFRPAQLYQFISSKIEEIEVL